MRKTKPNPETKKLHLNKVTRDLLISFTVASIIVGSYFGVRYYSYQNMIKYMNITFNDKNIFEYSNERIDLHSMVSDYNGTLSIDPTVIDANKVGTYTASFSIKGIDNYGAEKVKSYTKFYTIEDTKAPIIALNADSVTITAGDGFDPVANIASVKDAVDGDLTKAEAKTNGSYTVTSNVDTNTAGNYTVAIEAIDKNGKVSTSEYAVTVNAKPTSSGGGSYGGGSWGGSSGGSSSGGSSSGGGDGCTLLVDDRKYFAHVSEIIYSTSHQAGTAADNDSRTIGHNRGVEMIECAYPFNKTYGYFYWWE